jgi:preprotein translocase subunit SecD
MKSLNTLLQDADPVRREGTVPLDTLIRERQLILEETIKIRRMKKMRYQPRTVFLAIAALIFLTALFLGFHLRSLSLAEVYAAVKFEVKLAEDHPGPGLQEAKVSGSERTVFLSKDPVVTNGDISRAAVLPGNEPSQFNVSVEFTPAGGQKMQSATEKNMGKRLAILLDGQVVMAPTIRSAISSSAVITGNFTKAEAERIVNGLR